MTTITRLILAAVLAYGSGCARPDWIEQTLVTVDVTGRWQGSTGTGWFQLDLEQQGSRVKGSVLGTGVKMVAGSRISGPIDGAVAGDVFTFRQTNGNMTGETTVSGDEMSGQLRVFGPEQILLRRIK